MTMDHPALARLDAAISRLEQAIESHRAQADSVRTRHATLKERMSEAVAALDQLIARGEKE